MSGLSSEELESLGATGDLSSSLPSLDQIYTKEEREAMAAYDHRVFVQPKIDMERYLKRLKPALAKSIRQYVDNLGRYHDVCITKQPVKGSHKQKESGCRFRHVFINGDYDTFFDCGGGEISIGIGNGNYLTFAYCD